VVNYNVPVQGSTLKAAKAVAREVSERGGGLPGVEVRVRADMAYWCCTDNGCAAVNMFPPMKPFCSLHMSCSLAFGQMRPCQPHLAPE
jgi:hypothetical protein